MRYDADTRIVIDDLVTGNHILAAQNVADAYGHISARHPANSDRYLIARATAPELVTAEDIMEVALNGDVLGGDTRKAYLERYIHAAIYQARPDITSVVHAHTHSVLPFSVTQQRLRPITHNCATIGREIPVWDQRTTFGDTNLLVSSMDTGRELANVLGPNNVVLMRGHGATVTGHSVREAVYTAVYLQLNAELQIQAGHFPPITFLSDGEVDIIRTRLAEAKPGEGYDRAWEYWSRRASG